MKRRDDWVREALARAEEEAARAVESGRFDRADSLDLDVRLYREVIHGRRDDDPKEAA